MDYYFWNLLSVHVYRGRAEPFRDIKELKNAIKSAWVAVQDIDQIHTAILQFLPRLREVVKQEGGPIQHIFG